MPDLRSETRVPTQRLFELQRRERLIEVGWHTLLAAALSLASTVDRLHQSGIVVGDLALENSFVDTTTGAVTLIDADSFSVISSAGKRLPARHYRPENTPVEFLADPSLLDARAEGADRFALAVAIARLLLEGFHPFAGAPLYKGAADEEEQDEALNIIHGVNWLTHPEDLRTREHQLAATILPEPVRQLFWDAFVLGHRDPDLRPDAEAWAKVLRTELFSLSQCDQNARHLFGRHLDDCPWCEWFEKFGRDPYPCNAGWSEKDLIAPVLAAHGASEKPVRRSGPRITVPDVGGSVQGPDSDQPLAPVETRKRTAKPKKGRPTKVRRSAGAAKPTQQVVGWGPSDVSMGLLRVPGGPTVVLAEITADGDLKQWWPSGAPRAWNCDYPAHQVSNGLGIRFSGQVCMGIRDAGSNLKTIVAVTSDGRLAQLWDDPGGRGWNLDFPADAAGRGSLRFSGQVCMGIRDAGSNLKTIVAVTSDGRLAQLWDDPGGRGWNLDFPADAAGRGSLQFSGQVCMGIRDAGSNLKTIVAVTSDGRLAQLWDDPGGRGWNLDFPADAAGRGSLQFSGQVCMGIRDAGSNLKTIVAVTSDGRLAQLWDDPGVEVGTWIFLLTLQGGEVFGFRVRCVWVFGMLGRI